MWLYPHFEGLRSCYGDVVTLHLPRGIKWAVLNSAQAIHEGFVVNAEFLSEFHHSIVGVILEGKFVIHNLPKLHNDKKILKIFLYQVNSL